MPVHTVRKGGKVIGYRYGKTGKLYRGKGAKAKAKSQESAINISKARRKGHRIPRKK